MTTKTKKTATTTDVRRFIPCDGANLGVHGPCVYLERQRCGGKVKGQAVYFTCVICQQRRFARGSWLSAKLMTANECRAAARSLGLQAVDGRGVAI